MFLVFPVGLLVALLSPRADALSFHVRGEISGFDLRSCGSKSCLTLKADRAFTGSQPMNFAFPDVELRLLNKQTGLVTTLTSRDSFYDSLSRKVFIRKISGAKGLDAVFDLETEELMYYPAPIASP